MYILFKCLVNLSHYVTFKYKVTRANKMYEIYYIK